MERYNGWANRPTWQVVLWIDSTEGMRERAQEVLRETLRFDSTPEARQDVIREFVEEVMLRGITSEASLASDILRDTLNRVDWQEVVDALEE